MLEKSEIQIQCKDNARLLHIDENILLFKTENFADFFYNDGIPYYPMNK